MAILDACGTPLCLMTRRYCQKTNFTYTDCMNQVDMSNKKVFVSGCYDLLHSGHVEFFRQAAEYGDLYVGIGS